MGDASALETPAGAVPQAVALPGMLARRAARAIRPALPYTAAFLAAQKHMWTPDEPEGSIIMTMAENKLCLELLQRRLAQEQEPCPYHALTYDNFTGNERFRAALAGLLEDTFMKGIVVDPNHLVACAGCGSVLDTLFFCIAAPGSGVLIPTPYYPAFDNDLEVRSQVIPVPFALDEELDIIHQLEAASTTAVAAGHPIAALLITNPNNPVGTMYSRATLVALLTWCLASNVHLVSDEIYGNSKWDPSAPDFVSMEVITSAEAPQLPGGRALSNQLVHVVWGLSKDFGASGLRVGCLHTRNTTLLQALSNLAYFCGVSGHTQWLITRLLEDKEWTQSYIADNHRRMHAAYTTLAGALDAACIPHTRANSAMFAWVDLRSALLQPGWAGEEELWSELAFKRGVVLTPGHTCHANEPGFFRFCWAWCDPGALPHAVSRIAKLLQERAVV